MAKSYDLGKVVGELLIGPGYADQTFQNELSTAGCKGWYYKDLDKVSDTLYQLTICDKMGQAVTNCLLGDGAEISWKADYSANFCGTISFTNRSVGLAQVTLYNELPSNWIPSAHQYDYDPSAVKPGRGYIWSPENPGLGKVEIGIGAASFGYWNNANELGSFAVGEENLVDGRYAFSSGSGNKVGYNAASFGQNTEATGLFAVTDGLNTKANKSYQRAHGRYNVEMPSDYIDIVGWGTSSVRKNVYLLDKNGNLYIRGNVYVEAEGNDGVTGARKIEDEVFVIKKTSGQNIDRSYDEIEAAYNAGKAILLVDGSLVYNCETRYNGQYYFVLPQYQGTTGSFSGIRIRRYIINADGQLTSSTPNTKDIMPNPPSSGTYTLKSVDGILKWV